MSKVKLTGPWIDPDGKRHKGGDVVDVADHRARELVRGGRAAPLDDKGKPVTPADTAAAGKGGADK